MTDYQITITERGGAEEVIDGSAIDFSYVSTGAVQELQEAQNSFNWMYAFSIRRITPWWWKLPTTKAF